MKRYLAALFALVMILSCVSAMASGDPAIVGSWYMMMPSTPEGGEFGDTYSIMILSYLKDGRVLYSMLSLEDGSGVTFAEYGTWTPSDELLSLWPTVTRDGRRFLTYVDDGGTLYAEVIGGIYMGFHRMVDINILTEIFTEDQLSDRF